MTTLMLSDYHRDLQSRPEARTLVKHTMTEDGVWIEAPFTLTRDGRGLHDQPADQHRKATTETKNK